MSSRKQTSQVTYDVSGKVALVTGASTGIGRATAFAFGHAGAAVVLTSRAAEAGDEVARLINEEGGQAIHQVADVSGDDDVAALVHSAVDRFGRPDIVFNARTAHHHSRPCRGGCGPARSAGVTGTGSPR